ncbi:MAG: RluA family pseudouridine synthase [Kiritimatiellae bacterium]|nr:RluA family pseudouridine synthase [Kiritimatiellia bacterium]
MNDGTDSLDCGNDELPAPEAPDTRTLSVPPEGTGGIRLDLWLVQRLPDLSRSRIQALLREGHIVATDGTPLRSCERLKGAAELVVSIPPPVPVEPHPEEIPLDIFFEDADCLVLNKPAGLVVHSGPGHPDGTLVNALLFHCKDLAGIGGFGRPGIVHRLDKDTSGLMMVAKTDAAYRGFTMLFQNGGVRKEYLCLVHGAPGKESGRIETLIGRHPVLRQHWAVVDRNGRRAVSNWKVEHRFGRYTLMRVHIETGRTHQIRVHMNHIGCPVLGDAMYGRSSADASLDPVPQRQMLHSTFLAFPHPVSGEPLSFTAPLPPDFQVYLGKEQISCPPES